MNKLKDIIMGVMFFVMFLAVVYTGCQAISSGGSLKYKIDDGVKERAEIKREQAKLKEKQMEIKKEQHQRYAELEAWLKNKGLWRGGYVLR